MTWQNIIGHDRVAEQFRRAASRGRLAGSFLFVGPSGVGKRTFALALAKSLLCEKRTPQEFNACGTCPACRQLNAGNHPDFYYVAKPEDKSELPLELLIGGKEQRGRSGICYEISRKPFAGGYKIAVIDDADSLNTEGANALLKTLEEPPPHAILILIGTSAAKQLPTIRSRCKMIRFFPLETRELAQLLEQQGIAASQERAMRLAQSSDGGLELAKAFCDDSLDEIRDEFFRELSLAVPRSVPFAIKLNEFVDAAGKEAILRRKRLRLLLVMALDFYQNFGRMIERADPQQLKNRDLTPYFQNASAAYRNDVFRVNRSAYYTLEALEQIDRNVQLPYIVDVWLHNLTNG
ncbi:MAG: DNA polymerase III subunit delta' [Planctomycetaceae bacterium]|jgi:DNA polymerase-3 subunit delta'|nr:DNA polymerase III subunit delta' [Planctomycetaceae bacterium]